MYIDKSEFKYETIRSHGYAPIGKPCIDRYNWQAKKRANIIGALYKKLNRHGHRTLWLPPYSPDLNPIEKKCAQAKFLRQGWTENNLPKLLHNMSYISFIMD